jgi:hypothetical protein
MLVELLIGQHALAATGWGACRLVRALMEQRTALVAMPETG